MKIQNRIPGLDILRGIAVIFMVFDHLMFDLLAVMPDIFSQYPYAVLNFCYKYWNSDIRQIVRMIIVFIFLLLAGICCSFSKSNLKRGVKLGAVSVVLTLTTFLIGLFIGDLNYTIIYGILHCIATALILIGLFEKFGMKKSLYLIIGAVLVLFGAIFRYKYGTSYTDFGKEPFLSLVLKSLIGMRNIGGDCFQFPLYGGMIFIGVYLGKTLYKDRKPLIKGLRYNGIIAFLGRHSLLVYVLHQIIIPVILFVIFLALGYQVS